jgi:hypothetical protein
MGISVSTGSIAEYKPPVVPPQSSDYPPIKLIQTFASLSFGKDDRFLYVFRNRPLQVPEGSDVTLGIGTMGGKYDSLHHRLFVIAKTPVFTLTFGVAPINAAVGFLPRSTPQPSKVQQGFTTYSFAVTMKIEVQRETMSASEVDDYVRWADGLWAYLRERYDIKRPS